MTAVNYIMDYLNGRLPFLEAILITVCGIIVAAVAFDVIKRLRRKGKNFYGNKIAANANISHEINEELDTPFMETSFPLSNGSLLVYWWDRLRDACIRYFYYNSLTVIRLKNEGKADHRAYVLKQTQMSTINWDNCTYNVKQSCLLPVRRNFFMVVIEGCTEPLDLWQWKDAMSLVEMKVNKENYDTWSEDLKKKFGKFSFDAKLFYNKMNNRNIELLAMSSIPDMRLMFYASLVAAGVSILVALMFVWMDPFKYYRWL
ncbi:MAG: hypothetical protein MPEBLZ_04393 [Candidatus Methanoperedens nitroreducens]|uniref:Uncharacterized protein n=1 Tax=Candidatus Methanoperedens nitratireducens TaxID=1392998 RepID=A0A0P8CF28_9EURY|nr:MAG: hypothetical protein MPEBLZ_04393 [Candidatus Methanoperedens sp. BLZ1]